MITNLVDIPIDVIHDTFSRGFSDYSINFDMSVDYFESRFFGSEGNNKAYSHIAFDETEPNKPIGLILGGTRQLDGIKTLRCGILCMDPNYRRKGIAEKLHKVHWEVALKERCRQAILEVLSDNHKAIDLYKKLGYEVVYILKYYYIDRQMLINNATPTSAYDIRPISYEQLSNLRDTLQEIHMNWQNEFEYFSQDEKYFALGVYNNKALIGGIGVAEGKMHFLWVNPKYRYQGIGRTLVQSVILMTEYQRLNISFSSNASLENFVKKLGFVKNSIEQYEMYKPIDL